MREHYWIPETPEEKRQTYIGIAAVVVGALIFISILFMVAIKIDETFIDQPPCPTNETEDPSITTDPYICIYYGALRCAKNGTIDGTTLCPLYVSPK